eukprot:TRINITY_DN22822_c0_g1_i1.p1 TRINITY_DN22822_c0_g1~~TRINITY_DN22822_c0_g1_i1.p1  ORF type:complete len:473 (-),score=74.95 TRINITY_DN22822_c0_g1_i1:580-1998(-)
MGVSPPSALVLARQLQPCDPLHSQCWSSRGRRPRENIKVVVLGEHAMVGMDLGSSLREAARPSADVSLRFAGAIYLCQGLAELGAGDVGDCANDAVKDFLRWWISEWESWAVAQSSIGELADQFAGSLAQTGHLEADIILCSEHVIFCWLLRRRASVPLKLPMIHVLSMTLLEYVPSAWRGEFLQDFASWATRAEHADRDVFCTFMEHITLQVFWQTGVVAPFVPSLGSAMWSGARYQPSEAGVDVLVLRSAFWPLHAGVVLRRLVEHLVGIHPAQVVRVRWMDSFLGGSLSTDAAKISFLTWPEQARCTAALYIPSEFSQVKFREFYSMGVPLLVPSSDWLLRGFRFMYRQWGQLHVSYKHQLKACSPTNDGACLSPAALEVLDGWPFGAPFLDMEKDPPRKMPFWMSLADVERYSHLLRFDSLAALADCLQSWTWEEGHARSVLMQRHFAGTVVANVLRYYRGALGRLLS